MPIMLPSLFKFCKGRTRRPISWNLVNKENLEVTGELQLLDFHVYDTGKLVVGDES